MEEFAVLNRVVREGREALAAKELSVSRSKGGDEVNHAETWGRVFSGGTSECKQSRGVCGGNCRMQGAWREGGRKRGREEECLVFVVR